MGAVFHNNNVQYIHDVPPSNVQFEPIGVVVNAGQVVPGVNGLSAEILYNFFPGIPPPPLPVPFVPAAAGLVEFVPGELVVVEGESICQPCSWRCLCPPKGPVGEAPDQQITLAGLDSGRVAIFNQV